MTPLSYAVRLESSLNKMREQTGSDFPMQHLIVLLDVAAHPDTPIGQIAKRLNMPKSSASRAVAALSDWSWTKKNGYGLVKKEIDPMESRSKVIRLTAEGMHILQTMTTAFNAHGKGAS